MVDADDVVAVFFGVTFDVTAGAGADAADGDVGADKVERFTLFFIFVFFFFPSFDSSFICFKLDFGLQRLFFQLRTNARPMTLLIANATSVSSRWRSVACFAKL